MLRLLLVLALVSCAAAQCLDGYKYFAFKDNTRVCVKVHFITAYWSEAWQFCSIMQTNSPTNNAQLLSIQTKEKDDAIMAYLRTLSLYNIQGFWMGGHALEQKMVYKWVHNRQPLTYTNWYQGEPNNSGNQEDCLEFQLTTWKWNDINCQKANPFICEYYL